MSYNNYNHDYRRNKIKEPAQLLAASDLFHPTAAQDYMLGCIFETNDGRAFRYCKDSGTGITRARMACSLPPNSAGEEIAQTGYTHSVGDTVFSVLMGTGCGFTDGNLAGGYMFINKVATVLGDFYIIKDNKWVTSDTILQIEIADTGGLRTALAAADEMCILPNRCYNVKVNPTSQDAAVIGVPLVDVTASYYFWAQYRGICPIITDAGDTPVIGEPLGKAGTAGTAGGAGVVANDGTDCVWGTIVSAGDTAEISLIDLLIP